MWEWCCIIISTSIAYILYTDFHGSNFYTWMLQWMDSNALILTWFTATKHVSANSPSPGILHNFIIIFLQLTEAIYHPLDLITRTRKRFGPASG